MRKKRLVKMIVLVVSCALFLSVIAFLWMKKDKEEYARWQAQYVGVWEDSEGSYKITVRRVTSAHVVFSLNNKKNGVSLDYATATATGDGEYSFQYNITRNMAGNVSTEFGDRANGKITLKEKSLTLVVPKVDKFENCLEFHGNLQKKNGLSKKKKADLQSLLGGDKPKDYDEDKGIYIVEEEAGEINRIFINWEMNRFSHDSEKYEIAGINPICFASDLQAQFGDPVEEEELAENHYKRVYEKDGYRYWFITDGYGLVVQGDCQYEAPKKGRRVGDFLMDGDKVIRYWGDYQKKRTIALPKGTKSIASGAFSVAPNMLSWKQYVTSEVTIPKDVQIEKEAFRNCARLKIILEEGRTTVPKEAFAHMVNKDNLTGKSAWVEVTLPKSLRRLEEKAFETIWIDRKKIEEEEIIDVGVATQPVTVRLNDELEYIGDNALHGICNTALPKKIKYLGTNFHLMPESLDNESVKLTQPGKSSDVWTMVYLLQLPEQLEEVAESGLILGNVAYDFGNSVLLKVPKNCNTVPYMEGVEFYGYDVEEGNKNYCDKDGWLFSKDGKVLYGTSCEVDYVEKKKGRKIVYQRAKSVLDSSTYIFIEEGVEEIAAHALSEINYSEAGTNFQYITPKSLKCIDREALFSDSQSGYITCTVKIAGKVPQFRGELSKEMKFTNKVYVKQQYREHFIKELLKGQNVTDKQKKQLKKCIVGY